ncbi:MAG: hypothetical protein H0V29_12670 [Thermoleophilaceae bacterium]|nr:hypothetical protein [Thermoleophilaceae bacterium]
MDPSEPTNHKTEPDPAFSSDAPRWEEPPPGDWDLGADPPPRPGAGFDPTPLFALIEALRRGLPADLQQQFTSLVREVLLALRALIDWYLDRLERQPKEPRVEDIPID